MFDVVTVGSATKDVYLHSNDFVMLHDKHLRTGVGICLNYGSKVEVHDMAFETGGGSTNTAVSFARMGLKVACFAKIGDDAAGYHILKELKREGVDTSLIAKIKKIKSSECNTGYSTILSSKGGERTILVFRGANGLIERKDFPFKKCRTKWIYLGSLSERSAKLVWPIVDFAHKNKIKVAWNPGSNHLKLGLKRLGHILKSVDVLILNREEGSLLTGVPYKNEKKIFKKIDEHVKGIVVMTEGKNGSMVSDGKHVYRCGTYGSRPIDTLGAGDSFGSGFVAALIKRKSFEDALRIASLNASSVVTKIGAKAGLLHWKDLAKKEKSMPNKLKITKKKLAGK